MIRLWGTSQMKEVDAEDLRIDLRTPDAIHWLNDIETGRQYWHWPQTLNMLLQARITSQTFRCTPPTRGNLCIDSLNPPLHSG